MNCAGQRGPVNELVLLFHDAGSSCSIYCWGAGMSRPTLLPRPSVDIGVTQVSAGCQQMSAVTHNGRLLVWEVSSLSLCPSFRVSLCLPHCPCAIHCQYYCSGRCYYDIIVLIYLFICPIIQNAVDEFEYEKVYVNSLE